MRYGGENCAIVWLGLLWVCFSSYGGLRVCDVQLQELLEKQSCRQPDGSGVPMICDCTSAQASGRAVIPYENCQTCVEGKRRPDIASFVPRGDLREEKHPCKLGYLVGTDIHFLC